MELSHHGVGSVIIEGDFRMTFDNGEIYQATRAEIGYPDNEECCSYVDLTLADLPRDPTVPDHEGKETQ